MENPSLKKTPLFDTHVAAGARMVPFGGWNMPVQYPAGIIAETRTVRENCGIFDVSHMARIEFSGASAVQFLDTILSVHVAAMKPGRSKYHMLCNERGGIIDDAIVYRLEEERCLLVVNAANANADMAWIRPRAEAYGGVTVKDVTSNTGMIAVQGPRAVEITDSLSAGKASAVRRFRISELTVAGIPCLAARTGYTGEDGFELMPPADRTAELWQALKEAGCEECGLGARDVLRLEAGLMLHGNDMNVDTNPYEAGLEWTVNLEKQGCVSTAALRELSKSTPSNVIVGFKMNGRAIPRQGMSILLDGEVIGTVTSGTHSPTLDMDIGMGYVQNSHSEPGTAIDIEVRNRVVPAEIVELPFYKRP